MINNELKDYIYTHIIPQYTSFDKGHNIEHITTVIEESMNIAADYPVDSNMVFTIAAYHDIGIPLGRKEHHIHSGMILKKDRKLTTWFTEAELIIMQQAVEDHRASNTHEPRSIYGKIISEADRQIAPEIILKRSLQYSLQHYPSNSFDNHLERIYNHITDKYGENGYLTLWLNTKKNEEGLNTLREIMKDKNNIRKTLLRIYEENR